MSRRTQVNATIFFVLGLFIIAVVPMQRGPALFVNFNDPQEKIVLSPGDIHYNENYFVRGNQIFILKQKEKRGFVLMTSVERVEWTSEKFAKLSKNDPVAAALLRTPKR